jgi:hypothetical protein
MPALLDRYLAKTGFSSQQTDERTGHRDGNLFEPLDDAPGDDHGAHDGFSDHALADSPAWWLRSHAGPLAAVAAVAAGAMAIAAARQ